MAQQLSLAFYRMLKTKNKTQLNQGLSGVSQSGVIDLKGVATGMEADATAICDAISSKLSNTVVEGHVNRVKMLKRQMYGRAQTSGNEPEWLHPGCGRSIFTTALTNDEVQPNNTVVLNYPNSTHTEESQYCKPGGP